MRTKIAGFGHYVPERIVSNAEIESRLSLSDGWIEQRTGICERCYAHESQAATDLAFNAAKMAIKQADIQAEKIRLILLATSTPDHVLPPSAPLLARHLGCQNAGAMDIAGACTGFIYSLALADSYVRVHNTPALVVASNILSRRINPEDRATCSLFADAAGAVVLMPSDDEPNHGLLALDLANQGKHYDLIKIEAGGSRNPFTSSHSVPERSIKLLNGRMAYAAAIDSMVQTSCRALRQAAMLVDDIDWWIPHQANERLLEAVRKELKIPKEKVLYSLKHYGNSSAATIPLTLSLYRLEGRIKKGQTILLTAVGAGFTEGAIIYRF